MKAESVTKVSIFYIMQVYYCCFLTIKLRRVCFTMKVESVTKVSIFYIMVQVYYCCFLTVKLRRVCFTMKAESVTKVSIFLLLVYVYCCFSNNYGDETISFHYEGSYFFFYFYRIEHNIL